MKTSRLARRGALVAALAGLGAIALPAAAQPPPRRSASAARSR